MKGANSNGKIPCPCMECGDLNIHTFEDLRGYVLCSGLDTNSHRWILHREWLQRNMKYSKVRNVNIETQRTMYMWK